MQYSLVLSLSSQDARCHSIVDLMLRAKRMCFASALLERAACRGVTIASMALTLLCDGCCSMVVSCHLNLNMDRLVSRMWDMLGLVRVYTRRRGEPPDLNEPSVLTTGQAQGCVHVHDAYANGVRVKQKCLVLSSVAFQAHLCTSSNALTRPFRAQVEEVSLSRHCACTCTRIC